MTEVVFVDTGVVEIVKAPVVAPPATATVAGTVTAAVTLLVRLTFRPADGATDARVTVPDEVAPPATVFGDAVTELMDGGRMVRSAVTVAVNLPVIVAVVLDATPEVVTVNVAELEPDETLTLAGTTADALLLLKVTDFPPPGAFAVSVTVPVELVPPVTELGDRLTVESDCACAAVGTSIASNMNKIR